DEHGAIAVGQHGQGPIQRRPSLPGQQLFLGSLRPVSEEEGAVAGPVAVVQVGWQQIVQRHLDGRGQASPLVQRGVRHDAIQPRAELRALLERADLAKDGEEHVLQDLLGVAGIARDAEGEPVEPGRIALHEAFERSGVARLQALHGPTTSPSRRSTQSPVDVSTGSILSISSGPPWPLLPRASTVPDWMMNVTHEISRTSLPPSGPSRDTHDVSW